MAECEFGVAMCGCLLGLSNEALVDGVSCILARLLALCIVDCDMNKVRETSQWRYIYACIHSILQRTRESQPLLAEGVLLSCSHMYAGSSPRTRVISPRAASNST